MTSTAELDDFWIGINELARQKGIAASVMSRRITKLEAQGLLETRLGPRNSKLVNLVAYDRIRSETRDAIREGVQDRESLVAPPDRMAPFAASAGADPNDKSLAREQARRMSYQAELSRLDLEERLGKLIAVEDVSAAMSECAEAIVRGLEQLPSRADEIAAAVGREGPHGARTLMKSMVLDVRKALEREMRRIFEESVAAHAGAEKEAAA
ncbi:hypothetical protein RZS28_03945 [Methylocapsa polymorpha]|uniref:Uncharacterized protein n=1 Tax=Methylocapsa polymorpha TaxID=3080828 RepID=A0ABZ0HT28_9HYPH|nr:hypothetical protein RZS28_03945 [Methylocapsa sp. RX1]